MSVLIAEAGEEKGFFVFLHMLVHYDMKSLFLPVSSNSLAIRFRDFLSCIWRTFRWPSWSNSICKSLAATWSKSKWLQTISRQNGLWLCFLVSFLTICCLLFLTCLSLRAGNLFSESVLRCSNSWSHNSYRRIWWRQASSSASRSDMKDCLIRMSCTHKLNTSASTTSL